MDNSSIGAGVDPENSPERWLPYNPDTSSARTRNNRPIAGSNVPHRAGAVRHGLRIPTGYSRSVSLPQALHSFASSKQRRGAKVLESTPETSQKMPSAAGTVTYDSNYIAPGERSVSAGTPHQAITDAKMDATSSSSTSLSSAGPVSPSTKRAISQGHCTDITLEARRFGRSQTTPRLVEILQSGETQLLDPLPGVNDSLHYLHLSKASDHVPTQDTFSPSVDLRTTLLEPPTRSLSTAVDNWCISATERALSNPDILRHILDALDSLTVIPHELVQQRRKPLSLRHAQMIFGDNKHAVEAWERMQPTTTADLPGAGLYSCLFVNSVWYEVAVRILEDRIHFKSNDQWIKFTRRGAAALSRKPRMLVLHKLNEATQVELDMVNDMQIGECLEWLEFYTCAGLAPPLSLLGSQLTRIILPGCHRVSNRTLAQIASNCSKLEHLDVRACEQVSDRGIKMIAKYCPQLQLLNVGRTRGGDLISYKGIKHLARQTEITTLGIAGCDIDDRAIWELALNRGPKLQRLSLNNCRLLTDASVPRVLGYMPNLTVLEIRGCTQITHMRPIALFKSFREKQGQPPLIEGCEVIERRLQAAVMRLQRETSHRILSDLLTWVNDEDNEKL